jgi:hypothetical protein
MWQAQILTPCTGAGTAAAPFRPQLVADYAPQAASALAVWTDITGVADMPPAVNVYVVEVTCEAATLDAIEGDARYQIISAEEVVNAE